MMQNYHLLQYIKYNCYSQGLLIRSKCLGSGWLYQKTKGTLSSPTSLELSDSTVESPLKQYQKKVTETKVVNIANGILKIALFTQSFIRIATIIM